MSKVNIFSLGGLQEDGKNLYVVVSKLPNFHKGSLSLLLLFFRKRDQSLLDHRS